MATINIPGNYDRVSTSFINTAMQNIRDTIDYTKKSNEIFIYSNFPEYLTDEHLGDGNTPCYINKVSVPTRKSMLIYLTHHLDYLSGNYTLGIRVYNPNSNSITFTKKHEGYSNTHSWNNPGYAWEDFFANKSGTTTVPGKTSVWLVQKEINKTGNAGGSFFDYFGEFDVSGEFVIAVYVCKNINNIPESGGNAIDWTNNDVTYSGYSNNYTLNGTKELDMANALVSMYESYFFGISNPQQGLGSSVEKIPITLSYDNQTEVTTEDNVGNYGLQYDLKFTFTNSGNTPIRVKAYIISNHESHFAGLSSENGCSKFLYTNDGGNNTSNNRWNFYTSDIISKSGSATIDLTYCHLALGSRGAILQFEAVPVE